MASEVTNSFNILETFWPQAYKGQGAGAFKKQIWETCAFKSATTSQAIVPLAVNVNDNQIVIK